MLFWKFSCFAIVFCCLCIVNVFPFTTLWAEDSVSISEIVSTWRKTRIKEVTCEIEVESTSWRKKEDSTQLQSSKNLLDDLAGLKVEIDKNNPQTKTSRLLLRRHEDFGMRITGLDIDEDDNVLKDIGIRVRPGEADMAGTRHVIIRKAGETLFQSQTRTIALMYWLDPLATRICTRISRLPDRSVPIVDDPDYGPTVQLTLREGDVIDRVVLAKNFDWRIVTLSPTRPRGGAIARYVFEYPEDATNSEKLVRATTTFFSSFDSEHPITMERIVVVDSSLICDPAKLKIEIPTNSRVNDYTGDSRKVYLVRNDGSIRDVTSEELRLAAQTGGIKQLLNTDEGELFGKAAPNRTSLWIIIAGVLLVGAAIVLMLKRPR